MANLSINKYTELLFFIILFLLAMALLDERGIGTLIVSLIFLGVIILIIRKLYLNPRFFLLYLGCALVGFLFDVVGSLKLVPKLEVFFVLISNFIYSVFIVMAIILLILKISAEKRVTIDTIRGAFCIHLFIGTLWCLFYQSISLLDPKAFFYSVERKGVYQLMYFSFTTLTTAGYGDIVPLNRLAMVLSNLEAMVGQLFPAVFIARLVSLYSVRDVENQD